MSQAGPVSQSRAPGSAALTISFLRFQDTDGRLALADSGATEAYLVDDGAGRLVLDDTVSEGLTIAGPPSRIFAYDTL